MNSTTDRSRSNVTTAIAVTGGLLVALAALVLLSLEGSRVDSGPGLRTIGYSIELTVAIVATGLLGLGYAAHVTLVGWRRHHAVAAAAGGVGLVAPTAQLLATSFAALAGIVAALATTALLVAGVGGLRRDRARPIGGS